MEKPADNNQKHSADLPTSTQEIARVILVGAGVGLLVTLLSELIQRFFIQPVFCNPAGEVSTVCANGDAIAFNSTLVIISIAAVAVMVKMGIFRPLLVAVGPLASLWGINSYLNSLSALEFGFWMLILFSLAYVLFYWLMRARNFVVSLVALIIAVVIIRLVLYYL